MSTDGGLRQVFTKHVRDAHWQAIESWSTGQGVPDANYCLEGCDGWIENKTTSWWSLQHPLSPEQVAWGERRSRVGGRYLMAVRRQFDASPRRGAAVDELAIFGPEVLRQIATTNSIRDVVPRLYCTGGPSRWNWDVIRVLMKETPR